MSLDHDVVHALAPSRLATQEERAGVRASYVKQKDVAVTFSDIIAALTFALDLTAHETSGHTLRACILGMRIGGRLRLPPQMMSDLYYALLLKDAGCSSNAGVMCRLMGMDETLSKHAARSFDWSRFEWRQLKFVLTETFREYPLLERVAGVTNLLWTRGEGGNAMMVTRCEAGSRIAHKLGLSENTAAAIRAVDEHWDGKGQPRGLHQHEIPLLSQIASIAQNLEIFEKLLGRNGAVKTLRDRSGRWFDPPLVKLVTRMHRERDLWSDVPVDELMQTVSDMEPRPQLSLTDDDDIDGVCHAFAEIIDAKSPYTFQHSERVAAIAEAIGAEMGLKLNDMHCLRRAALLHDIGKLGVANTLLDKDGPLDEEEWQGMRRHPVDSYQVLRRIAGFDEIAVMARAHHEKLDGTGYPDGLRGDEMGLSARILAVADMYDGLISTRPYRKDFTQDEVLDMLRQQTPHALDVACVDALLRVLPTL